MEQSIRIPVAAEKTGRDIVTDTGEASGAAPNDEAIERARLVTVPLTRVTALVATVVPIITRHVVARESVFWYLHRARYCRTTQLMFGVR